MSKTFIFTIAVIAVYFFIIFPSIKSKTEDKEKEDNKTDNKSDSESGTGLNDNADKNGVSQGAAGQQKYRIGYTK